MRRRLLSLLVIFSFVAASPASAGLAQKPKKPPKKSTATKTAAGQSTSAVWSNTTKTVSQKGTKGKYTKPPTANETAAKAKVNPCPTGEFDREVFPGGAPQDLGEKGDWAFRASRCSPQDGWVNNWVCVARCPVGTPTYVQPQKPSWDEVRGSLYAGVPTPEMRFAPPVEENDNAAAIVGKRLYVNLAPESFTEFAVTTSDATGYWYATAHMEPVSFQFGTADDYSDDCPGPGTSGRTAQGRAMNDANGCYIIINNKPASGILTVQTITTWRVTITSNNNLVPQFDDLQTSSTFDVPVKQIQSIRVN